MKTIGLLGGMSWESTLTYYQIINMVTAQTLGGLHSARCLLYSVDFDEIERCQQAGDWDKSARILAEAAQALERGGADFLVICTNTMHKVAPQIAAAVGIPLMHIADVTARQLYMAGVQRVGLLGTRYTMEEDFYTGRLEANGLQVLVPEAEARAEINRVIFEELCRGVIKDSSRETFLRAIRDLAARGAQGVILGCTEIGMLVQQENIAVPLFDTTLIHARTAALVAINETPVDTEPVKVKQ